MADYPLCASCGHEIGAHDPCSVCAHEGRTCRSYTTEKKAKESRYTPHRSASKRRKP